MTETVPVILSETGQPRLTALKEMDAAGQANGGRVPFALTKELARALDMTPRHLQRAFRAYRESGTVTPYLPRKRMNVLDENLAKNALFYTAGDSHAAYLLLRTLGLIGDMSLRTFQRRVSEWPGWLRAAAHGGYREMIKYQTFNREHIPYRTYGYSTDHTKLSIRVVPKRGAQPLFPWLTLILDMKTRVVISFVLTEHEASIEDSVAVLAEAIDGWTCERGFVGGKPEFLRSDRGGDFVSTAMNKGLLRIDVQRQFTEPYSSWQNGRVERLHGTIDREFGPTQPGFVFGGQDEYDLRVLKVNQPDESLGTLDSLDEQIAAWIETYNNRPHRALGGLTPLDAWFADPQPIQTADPAEIRTAMMRHDNRRVNKYGIDFAKRVYSSPRLIHGAVQVGTTVEVRYHPRRHDSIQVFHQGTWVCTATETSVQPQTEKLAIVSSRRAQNREVSQRLIAVNYQRAVAEHERQRAAGTPVEDLPALPPAPDTTDPLTSAPARRKHSNNQDAALPAAFSKPGSEAEIAALLNDRTEQSA